MQYYQDNQGLAFEPMTRAVTVIMVSMGVAYLGRALLHAFGLNVTPWFALSGSQVAQGMVWQFVTYTFLHHDLFHLLVNMLGLFFFGPHVEQRVGERQFYILFFLGGALGGLGWLLMSDSYTMCLGASGAVYGVLGAFAALNLHRTIRLLLFFVVPVSMKGWMVAVAFAGIEMMMLVSSPHGGIAYAAHLGGLLVGFIYAITWQNRAHGSGRLPGWLRRTPKLTLLSREPDDARRGEAHLNEILDKIAAEGMDSLTASEKRHLDKASRDMRGRGR